MLQVERGGERIKSGLGAEHITGDLMHRLERAVEAAITNVDDARVVATEHLRQSRDVVENVRVNVDFVDLFEGRWRGFGVLEMRARDRKRDDDREDCDLAPHVNER